MTCGLAAAQLQQYVAQVNQVANYQYQVIAANCRCNAYCFQTYLQPPNVWYMQQASLVNGWYSQISRECTTNGLQGTLRSRPGTADNEPRVPTDKIDELTVDDEDKTVRIRIPDTPRGFQ
jgi:hypothetical protein